MSEEMYLFVIAGTSVQFNIPCECGETWGFIMWKDIAGNQRYAVCSRCRRSRKERLYTGEQEKRADV